MSALPSSFSPPAGLTLQWQRMQADDVDEVAAIESTAYSHPWTRGNFLDSLYSGYHCWTLRDAQARLIGYFLLMHAPDEAHLLNITVAPAWQGRGLGRLLLERAVIEARAHGLGSLLLEVRPSNVRAIAIYHQAGFVKIGLRKQYYPAAGQLREDAIVMRKTL